MKLSESDLQQLYRSMTARRARQTDDCPGEELLIQAASNDLSDAQRSNVVAHLGRCSDCAREYRIARSLHHLESEGREEGDADAFLRRGWGVAAAAVIALMFPALIWLGSAWQRGQRTIAGLEHQIETQRQELESARHRPAPLVTESRNGIAEVIRPQVGVPIVDLDADMTRGAGTVLPAIVVPPTSDVFTLILHLNHLAGASLDIELADANGAVLWRDHIAPDPRSATIPLALNRRAVPAGAYAINVRSAGRLATFRFRVEYR